MYSIEFSQTAEKQFKKLEKQTQERIANALERTQIKPETHFKKLVDSPLYRLRAGDYRILAKIIHERFIILLIEIGHRKKVYD